MVVGTLICEDLAQRADKPEHGQVLRNLANQWLKAAIELERTYALLDDDDPLPSRGQ